MKQPTHIVFALEGFFPDNIGGTEYYVLNLATKLMEQNFKVSIIKPTKEKLVHNYIYKNIPVYCFPIPEKVTVKELNGLMPPSGIKEFTEILKQLKPDIFHLHSLGRALNTAHLKVAKGMGIETVFTSHLAGNFCLRGDFLYMGNVFCNGKVDKRKCLICYINRKTRKIGIAKLTGWFLSNSVVNKMLRCIFPAINIVKYKLNEFAQLKSCTNVIIAISEWQLKTYELNKITDVHLIKQAITRPDFTVPVLNPIENDINLTYIGRLMPEKGILFLIKAMAKVKNSRLCLNICYVPSDSFFEDEVRTEIAFHQLKVCFYPNRTETQINQILDDTHYLVVPSLIFETAPLVVLESFLKKVPVIGANRGGIADLVKHNVDGLLFDLSQPDALSFYLQEINDNTSIYQKLRNNINEQNNYSELVNKHISIYHNILMK